MDSILKKIETENVCSLPWVHTEINLQNDSIKPCCKFQTNLGSVSDGFKEVWFSETSKLLRSDLINKTIRQECNKCNVPAGTFAYRDWKNASYIKLKVLDDVDVNMPTLPKVFHFSLSNVCNLACRMCHPGSSSKINALALKSSFSKFLTPVSLKKHSISDFKGIFKNAEHIVITGGEPLVNEDCIELIDLILSESINLKSISFSTNMTLLNLDLLKKLFRYPILVNFNISIDGPPHIQEYVRVGSNWNKIVENIKYISSTYPQARFGINTTISVLTVGYLPELLENLINLQKELNIKFTGLMTSPVFTEYLQAGILPPVVKEFYKSKLKKVTLDMLSIPNSTTLISTANYLLSQDRVNNLNNFLDFMQVFDNEVNTNLVLTYPEFNQLVLRDGIEPPQSPCKSDVLPLN